MRDPISFRKLSIFVASAALLCPALAFGDETKPVIVKNTIASPVPVTGTVNLSTSGPLSVSGTVNAAQSGPWSMAVTGPVTTVPAEDPAKNAFKAGLRLGNCFTVPSGKRAVVEFVSVIGQNVIATPVATVNGIGGITTTLDGVTIGYTVPLTQVIREPVRNLDTATGGILMRAYADTQICASAFAGSFFDLIVTISGHLVSMP